MHGMTLAGPQPTLSSGAWASFVEHSWGRRPCLFRGAGAQPFATSEEVFGGLLDAGDRLRSGKSYVRFLLFREHARIEADLERHLPQPGDATLARYADRVTEQLGGRIGVILNDFQFHHAASWTRSRDFLRGLYETLGMLPGHAEIDLFLGNYASTPNGVHRDPASVFMFVIEGKKRLRAWPPDYFDDRADVLRGVSYEDHLPDAVTLEGGPGDMIYWPAGWWHVGESPSGLSTCLNLALFLQMRPSAAVLNALGERLRALLGAGDSLPGLPFDPDRVPQAGSLLPDAYTAALEAVARAAAAPEIELETRKSWLQRLTGYAFDFMPLPRQDTPPAADDIVQGDPRYPVVCAAASSERWLCGVNGYVFELPAHPGVQALVAELNTGRPLRVGSALREYSGTVVTGEVEIEVTEDGIQTLLETLWRMRAIEICPRQPGGQPEL